MTSPSQQRLGVGIIGLQPGRSWAARAHVPALRALPDRFRIAGVANTSRASAEAAAADSGITQAFDDVAALIASPEVDIVTVAVRVPAHLEIVKAAIAAGKHVYCEWPLGNGLKEAEEMADLARAAGVIGVVGTQALFAPEIAYLKQLITDSFVGDILSTSIVARGGPLQGSGHISDMKSYGYILDRTNGATLLTIPVGHSLAAITNVLGQISEVSASLATRRQTAIVEDTGQTIPVTAPDQVLIVGTLAHGAPLSLHFKGGDARDGVGLLWEINGTKGDIRVTGASGHMQMVPLALSGIREGETAFRMLPVPPQFVGNWPIDPVAGNVARSYAAMSQDIGQGVQTAPTFAQAVALHRIINAIEISAETGQRVRLPE